MMKYVRFLILSVVTLFFLLPGTVEKAEAQPMGIGFSGGMNVSSHLNNFRFAGEDFELDFAPDVKIGFQGGLIYRTPLTQRLRFQTEPSAIMLGASYDDTFSLRGFDFHSVSETQLIYVQLPLLMQLTTVPPEEAVFGRPRARTTYHLTGGVFGGYLLDAQFSGHNSGAPIGIEFQGSFSNDVRDQYLEFDGGVILGAGLERGAISKIGFETRVIFSVISSGDMPELNFNPQNMGITFGLYYLL